jgi:hypothetical protein
MIFCPLLPSTKLTNSRAFYILRCVYHCYGIGNRFANRDSTCYFISVFLPVFCIRYVYEAGVSFFYLYIRKYLFRIFYKDDFAPNFLP